MADLPPLTFRSGPHYKRVHMASKSKTVMLTLRIPASLRSALRSSAKGDHRSVNSYVASLLLKAMTTEKALR
jgi:hypothetical protein